MNIKLIESVMRRKRYPKCTIGTTRELAKNVYRCDYSMCNETYDYSLLSDTTIEMLLAAPTGSDREKKVPVHSFPRPKYML
jgi:hypothetical protein